MEASTPLIPLTIMVSGNKDSSLGLVPCDCRVPIPESKVSSDRPPLFIFQLSLAPFTDVLAAGPVRTSDSRTSVPICASVLRNGLLHPGVGRIGISANRSFTCCFPAFPQTGRSPAAFRPLAADCHVPGLAWLAFPRTGWSPAVIRPSAADCHAPGTALTVFFRTNRLLAAFRN